MKEESTLPVREPIPPITTINRILYVSVTLNVVDVMAPMNIAISAPPIPAKKELMIKESCLCFARLMPIASAAENIVFYIFRSHHLTDPHADFSGAADAAGGIDLNYFHPTFSQKKWYGNTCKPPPRDALTKK